MKKLFLVFIACLLHASCLLFIGKNAAADQCSYVSANTKNIAYGMLKAAGAYVDFCALCDGAVPMENKINKLEYKQVDYVEDGGQFYQIYINDEPVDIACIYVKGRNLGISAKCEEVSNVPEYIDNYLTDKDANESVLKEYAGHFYGKWLLNNKNEHFGGEMDITNCTNKSCNLKIDSWYDSHLCDVKGVIFFVGQSAAEYKSIKYNYDHKTDKGSFIEIGIIMKHPGASPWVSFRGQAALAPNLLSPASQYIV